MKNQVLILAFVVASVIAMNAQVPQAIKYQGVARDAAGVTLNTQAITVRLSIHDITSTGAVIYQETHAVTTNSFGLFNLNMGQGTAISGVFSSVNWGFNNKYIEQEIDFGAGFLNMGTSQFLSVPYALYAGNTSAATYTGGAGIGVTGSVITNTAPDQTVNISSGINTNVVGAYPNFTINSSAGTTYTNGAGITIASGSIITNSSPDVPVTFVNAGPSNISGTYPNFTLTSSTPSIAVTTTAATGASVTSAGNSFSINVPSPTFTNSGPATISGIYPNYTINSPAGTTYTNGTGISITSGSIISNTSPNITPTIAVSSLPAVSPAISSAGNSFTLNLPTPTIAVTTTAATAAAVSNLGYSYNINVPAPTFTNSGPSQITGVYPNYTITSAAGTSYTNGAGISITSGSIITNTSPNITPTIAITTTAAAGASITTAGNTFSINVPAPTFTNAGPTTITGSYPNYTVNSAASAGWDLNGNAGTASATNYLGTSDAQALVLRTNAVERMRVSATGLVGIGSNNPTEDFQIERTGSASAAILSGSTSISSLFFGTPAFHYWGNIQYNNNNNSMNFWTGNTSRMTINGSGNVAIGTSTAGINSGASRFLTVSSTTAYANSMAAIELEGGSLSTSVPVGKIDFNSAIGSNPSANIVRIAALRAGNATAGVLQLSTHDGVTMNERMRIAENGNASIGSITTNSARLNLFATTTDTASPVGLSVTNNYNGASNKFGIDVNVDGAGSATKFGISSTVVGLAGDGNGNYAYQANMTPNGSGSAFGNNTTINAAGAGIRYGNYTSVASLAANNSNTYGHRILMSGTNVTALKYGLFVTGEDMNYFANSVGIGTATPIYKLVVAGPQTNAIDGPNMSFVTSQDNYPTMHILNWNHAEQYLMFNTYFDGAFRSSTTTGNFKMGGYNGKLIFQAAGGYAAGTNMNANFVDAMMIGNNGYVGIGINSSTTQPAYPFHVNKYDPGVLAYFDNSTQSSGTGIRTEVVTTATSTGTRYGLYSQASNGQGVNYGTFSRAQGGTQSFGIWTESGGGSSVWNMGLYSSATGTNGVYAAYMIGNVWVGGTLSKAAGTFKIDHPQDPENKYLIHSFVESPDMMNVYNGNTTTDANGDAVVQLPGYFEAENINFRYQLTVMGQFAQAIVLEEVQNNQFKVKTDKPNVKVSWQVTGVRNDEYAKKNRVVPEVNKTGADIGNYLAPEVYGLDESRRIGPKREKTEDKIR